MFNEDELKVYDKKFQAIGILDKGNHSIFRLDTHVP